MTINYFNIPQGARARTREIENGRYIVRYVDTRTIDMTMPRNDKMGWDVYDFLQGGEDYTDADRAANMQDYTYDKDTAQRIADAINANAPEWLK